MTERKLTQRQYDALAAAMLHGSVWAAPDFQTMQSRAGGAIRRMISSLQMRGAKMGPHLLHRDGKITAEGMRALRDVLHKRKALNRGGLSPEQVQLLDKINDALPEKETAEKQAEEERIRQREGLRAASEARAKRESQERIAKARLIIAEFDLAIGHWDDARVDEFVERIAML